MLGLIIFAFGAIINCSDSMSDGSDMGEGLFLPNGDQVSPEEKQDLLSLQPEADSIILEVLGMEKTA